MQEYLAQTAAGQSQAISQAVHQPLSYTQDGGLTTVLSNSSPAVKWWNDFATPPRILKLQGFYTNWQSAGRPLVLDLFVRKEALKRSAGTQVPPGMICWDDGDMIDIMVELFQGQGLPVPNLSAQAWHLMWVKHEHDARNYIDLYHALDFAENFCRDLYALALQPQQNHIEVAPNLFLPSLGTSKPDWHKQYSEDQAGTLVELYENFDSAHLSETVAAIFGEVNTESNSATPDVLEFDNSEVQLFVRKVYAAHRLPCPNLSRSQWHNLAARFKRTYSSGMNHADAVRFVAFLHDEIQKGDADLHQIFTDIDPAVQQQALSNDWRQGAESLTLKGAPLQHLESNATLIKQIFEESDFDRTGTLRWQTSEIKSFVHKFFQSRGLPCPQVPDAVWYQWFREVDHNNNGKLELSEATEFVKHIMERILHLKGQLPAMSENSTSTAAAEKLRERLMQQQQQLVTPQDLATTPSTEIGMLLTSSGLAKPNFGQELLRLLSARKPGKSPKVLYIPDAMLPNGGEPTVPYNKVVNRLMMFGISHVDCVELAKCSKEMLMDKLQDADCIYVEGGNTYYLCYQILRSGFNELVPPLVQSGRIVYLGVSAGSINSGRTISVAFWKGWDDPGYDKPWDLRPYGYDGLNIVPGGSSIFPHYSQQWAELVQTKSKELDHDVIVIDEQHAFLIDGEQQGFI